MDFARKQLEKYGWKEGEGLGKEGNEGITKAIKPHYKTGKTGMGFDLAKELTDTWWTRSYDASLKAINVENNADNGSITVTGAQDGKAGSEPTISDMRKRAFAANFKDFSKGGTLSQGKLVQDSDSSDEDSAEPIQAVKNLTDEELWKACGGRTAHKGARHGLNLTGKLKRLAAQDEYFTLEKLTPEPKRTKKTKKHKKSKKSNHTDKDKQSESA